MKRKGADNARRAKLRKFGEQLKRLRDHELEQHLEAAASDPPHPYAYFVDPELAEYVLVSIDRYVTGKVQTLDRAFVGERGRPPVGKRLDDAIALKGGKGPAVSSRHAQRIVANAKPAMLAKELANRPHKRRP